MQILRSDGTEVDTIAFASKIFRKAIESPDQDEILLAIELGGPILREMASLDPKLQAALLLSGQDLADWFLNMFLVGTLTAKALQTNSLTLSTVNEETNESDSQEGHNGNSQAGGPTTD